MTLQFQEGGPKALFGIAVKVQMTDNNGKVHNEKIMVSGVKAYKVDSTQAKMKLLGAKVLDRKADFLKIESEQGYLYLIKTSPSKPLSCRSGCDHLIASQGLAGLSKSELLQIVKGVISGEIQGTYVAGDRIGYVEDAILGAIEDNSDYTNYQGVYKDTQHIDQSIFTSKKDTTWVDMGNVNNR